MVGWLAKRAGQSLRDIGQMLWPDRCCLCAQPGLPGLDLCRYCMALAWVNRPACARCALPLGAQDDAGGICGRCLRRPGPLAAVHAAWCYADPLDQLVVRNKFAGDLAAGRTLARLMASQPPPWLSRDLVLVPVPLHRQRLRTRGFDQALELVRLLSRATGLRWQNALERVALTQPQSTLSRAQRRRNLRGAFQALPGCPVQVILVDDVMTSGATLAAAARALQQGGAVQVFAWVAARTP